MHTPLLVFSVFIYFTYVNVCVSVIVLELPSFISLMLMFIVINHVMLFIRIHVIFTIIVKVVLLFSY